MTERAGQAPAEKPTRLTASGASNAMVAVVSLYADALADGEERLQRERSRVSFLEMHVANRQRAFEELEKSKEALEEKLLKAERLNPEGMDASVLAARIRTLERATTRLTQHPHPKIVAASVLEVLEAHLVAGLTIEDALGVVRSAYGLSSEVKVEPARVLAADFQVTVHDDARASSPDGTVLFTDPVYK